MKFRNKKLISLLTAGAIMLTLPISAEAITGGAGVSGKIAASMENSSIPANAGVSSALASCIDVSTARATISDGDASMTAAGWQESVCGYTNLGIANVESNLNIREQASEEAELVGKLPRDAGCEILGVEGEWAQIQSGEVTGYVKSEFLRTEPSTESEILALMPEGEEVEVLENLGEWLKVSVDSEVGYVSAEYVDVSNELPKAMTMTEVKYGEGVSNVKVDLVSYACQFVGNPYVWGGTSLTHGADCSGFTLSIYAKYGIYLPHSSAAQANYGRRVSPSEAQPGDLFFYGGGRISHVAIYIGNGQIVHASTARTGIKISNAFYRSPVCVVRLLD